MKGTWKMEDRWHRKNVFKLFRKQELFSQLCYQSACSFPPWDSWLQNSKTPLLPPGLGEAWCANNTPLRVNWEKNWSLEPSPPTHWLCKEQWVKGEREDVQEQQQVQAWGSTESKGSSARSSTDSEANIRLVVPPDVPIYGWHAPAASLLSLIALVRANAQGETSGPCYAQTLICCLVKQICH